MNVIKELTHLIREALVPVGGSGGARECKYCLRRSYPGQPKHYRVGVKSTDSVCYGAEETNEPCEVDVMKEARKLLRRQKS